MVVDLSLYLKRKKKEKEKEKKMYSGFYAFKLLKHYFKFNDILKIVF